MRAIRAIAAQKTQFLVVCKGEKELGSQLLSSKLADLVPCADGLRERSGSQLSTFSLSVMDGMTLCDHLLVLDCPSAA